MRCGHIKSSVVKIQLVLKRSGTVHGLGMVSVLALCVCVYVEFSLVSAERDVILAIALCGIGVVLGFVGWLCITQFFV